MLNWKPLRKYCICTSICIHTRTELHSLSCSYCCLPRNHMYVTDCKTVIFFFDSLSRNLHKNCFKFNFSLNYMNAWLEDLYQVEYTRYPQPRPRDGSFQCLRNPSYNPFQLSILSSNVTSTLTSDTRDKLSFSCVFFFQLWIQSDNMYCFQLTFSSSLCFLDPFLMFNDVLHICFTFL